MANIEQIADAVSAIILADIYPNGAIAGTSLLGFDVATGVGKADKENLTTALAAGNVQIFIIPVDGERSYARQNLQNEAYIYPQGLILSAVGTVVILDGTALTGNSVGIRIGRSYYKYAPNVGDTGAVILAAIAAKLLAVIAVNNTLSFPTLDYDMSIASDGLLCSELRNIDRRFQITIYAPTSIKRQAVSDICMTAIAAANRINVDVGQPVQEQAQLIYDTTPWSDQAQIANAYQQVIFFRALFLLTSYQTGTAILFPVASVSTIDNPQPYVVIPDPTVPVVGIGSVGLFTVQ